MRLFRPVLFAGALRFGSAATTMAPVRAGVIFMHGLGDSPAGWASFEGEMGPLLKAKGISVEFSLPAAPTAAVSINQGAKMSSWFDIVDWPISLKARDDPEGLKASVKRAHAAIEALEAKGVPAENIIVGGFSQGGAVALLAAYRYPKKLAGCVCLSGWLTMKDEFAAGANAGTPCFWGHGTSDPIVLPEQQPAGSAVMAQAGVSVTAKTYDMGHSSHPQEMRDLGNFLVQTLGQCVSAQ
ncbi:Phospholipase/carboxylesterase/thioesterase [Pelagophyceae sp. CCMP2097]|nr:Phospholipase/carboxylesterase/thioesterase [Pelagophyceae sp. CCMP2097]